nr:hypothetical protein GCM10020092_064400 [Actinoplanes digitatis]
MPVAIITGASRGLGLALTAGLADAGWRLVVDARGAGDLAAAMAKFDVDRVVAVPGDVTDAAHRHALIAAADRLGGTDLLVNNAGILGPSPQPPLADYPLGALREVYEVNVVAPLALIQLALPGLRSRRGAIVTITSDAAVEAYPGWGGYGSAKAAIEQAGRVIAAEELGRAGVVGRPRRPAYPDAPGGLPRAGHQRPAAARDRGAGLPAAARRRAAVGAHPPRRPARRGRPVTALLDFALPAALEAHEPPEARGRTRDGVRLLVGERVERHRAASPVHRPAGAAARRRRACRQHLGHPARPRYRSPAAR